jgi:hypothetical protein
MSTPIKRINPGSEAKWETGVAPERRREFPFAALEGSQAHVNSARCIRTTQDARVGQSSPSSLGALDRILSQLVAGNLGSDSGRIGQGQPLEEFYS